MKKRLLKTVLFFLGFVGLTSQKTLAQVIDTTTMEGLYQYVFSNLNKSRIPTNYLEEYGVPIVPMETFNGILTDSNKIDMNLWRTLYWQMQTAYTGTGTNVFGSIINTNASISSALTSANIPIPIILGNYNSVSPDAFTNNQLVVNNNQVLDGPNTSSPYINNNLFAASPAINFTKSGTASFVFSSNLFFNASSNTVSSLWIDFGDNAGYRSSSWNTPITANYADTGWHTLKIKLVLNDNSIRECYSKFYVQAVGGGTFAMNSHRGFESVQTHAGPFAGDMWETFTPLDYIPNYADVSISFPSTPNYIGGTAFIQYSSSNRTGRLQKPLIVVEGFDIFNVAPDIRNKPYSIGDFVKAISVKNTYPFNLDHHLDSVGYDIVYVQFTNGTADIKNNAAFLTAVIQQVDSLKAVAGSTQQNVIMGLSMGGLVARYALADMTKRGIATGTRLLITHDSPHQGANIPLGLQYLIQMAGGVHFFGYNVRDVYPQYDEALNLLTRAATNQLLLYTSTGPNTFSANTFLNGDYRNMITFQPTDPQPSYQFIATSLGSQCGQPLFQPYTNLINASTNDFIFLFPVLSYKLVFNAQAYALPNTGSVSTIASLSYKSLFKLFGLITIAKQIYNNSANSPGNHLPVDGVPGSTYPLVNVNIPNASPTFIPIPIPIVDLIGLFGYISYSSTGSPQVFSFVSTASALDVSPFDNTVFSQKFVGGANSSYPSTASTYIAQEAYTNLSGGTSYNNEHINFTPRNSEWLYDQMQNIANNVNCSSECAPNLFMSGPDLLCNSDTYQIPNLKTGTVTWSSSPANIVSITPIGNGYQATVSKTGGGNVTITATTNCGQAISKTIHVGGYGSSDYPVSGPSTANCNDMLTYTCPSLPGATNYSWFYPGGWTYISGQGTTMLALQATGASGYYQVGVRVASTCDAGGSPGIQNTFFNGCGFAPVYMVSPNPATTSIKVGRVKSSSQKNASSAIGFTLIQILDKMGNIKQQNKFAANTIEATIDISQLSTDIYTVRIYNGKTWEDHKLVVAR